VCSGVVALIEDGASFVSNSWAVCMRAALVSRWVVTLGVKWHVPSECNAACVASLVGWVDVSVVGLGVLMWCIVR
jgi:hypothetical protein